MRLEKEKKENLFYFIFLVTILLLRGWIIVTPEVDVYFFGVLIHHFWCGVVLLLIAFIIPGERRLIRMFLFAIGLGVAVDEFVFILLGAGREEEYWALPASLGTIALVIFIFSMKKKLTDFVLDRKNKQNY